MLIYNMSFDAYLADPAYGSSDMRAFRFGPPAMVPWQRSHRDETSTDATKLGTAAHALILEPASFDRNFIVKPVGMEFRSAEDKAKRDAWLASGLQIITQIEADKIRGVADAFRAKRAAQSSLSSALGREVSVFWSGRYGLPRKGRPDWYDAHAVYDLKVSIDAEKSLHTLRYKAFINGWLGQLAHNAEGLRANGVNVKVGRLVVIAPKQPHGIRVWLLEVSENDLDVLVLENENTERDMVQCHQSDVWPGTPDTWQKCPLPTDHMMADVETDMADATEVDDGA